MFEIAHSKIWKCKLGLTFPKGKCKSSLNDTS